MNNQLAGLFLGVLVCIGIFFIVMIVVYVLFLLTLMRTQAEVYERNREMSPGLVWLTLIPLFSTFWVLYMVPKLSNSLRNEFRDRGWDREGEGYARTMGLIWAWGGVASILLSVLQNAMQFGGLMEESMVVGLVGLPVNLTVFVCWIIYWVQMAGYGKRLRERGRRRYNADEEADYDDDYRPRDRDRDGDDDER